MGDRVVVLDLDIEDIHFERGKVMLVVSSPDHEIHIFPFDITILDEGNDNGGESDGTGD